MNADLRRLQGKFDDVIATVHADLAHQRAHGLTLREIGDPACADCCERCAPFRDAAAEARAAYAQAVRAAFG